MFTRDKSLYQYSGAVPDYTVFKVNDFEVRSLCVARDSQCHQKSMYAWDIR